MKKNSRTFPLAAVVGQDALKTLYLANIVEPEIGGLLISGPKGTGKSTVVHSIAGLLPDYEAVADCPFNCDPADEARLCSICVEDGRAGAGTSTRSMRIVNLPLSCTEDRLIGSIDIEALLRSGTKEVQAGILGQANRNILYVDEVNLLPDHLVDDILDAAASHWNTIEREGISVSHAASFVLVGTMNPEEGELRPQILDRFPLCVRLESIRDPQQRVEIVKRNLLFEKDPDALAGRFAREQAELRETIRSAREMLSEVVLSDPILLAIASACADLKVDGQRPDIVIVKTARALAALDGQGAVGRGHVLLAARFALNHRTRDGGLLDPPSAEEIDLLFARRLDEAAAAEAAERAAGRRAGRAGNPGDAAAAVKSSSVLARKQAQPDPVGADGGAGGGNGGDGGPGGDSNSAARGSGGSRGKKA